MRNIDLWVHLWVRVFIGAAIGAAILLIFSFVLGGCSSISYTSRDGAAFSRLAVGTDAEIQGLRIDVRADGSRTVEIDGLNSIQSKAIEAAAKGAASGAKGGM